MEQKQDRQMFAYLIEPKDEDKRQAVSKNIRGQGSVIQVDLATIKSEIRELRRNVISELPDLIKKFETSVPKNKQLGYTFAPSALEAAQYIMNVAGNIKDIVVNDSSLIKELKLPLEELGLRVNDTYFRQFGQLEGRLKPGELMEPLPKNVYSAAFQSFSKPVPLKLADSADNGMKKNFVAVVGVNAASAADGSVYLLQHASNIRDILEQAAKVVFIIGLEKLTSGSEEALFQVQCAGLFGFESRARNLARGIGRTPDAASIPKDSPGSNESDLSSFPEIDVPGPQEIHTILLDNGRLKIRESAFKDILTCISCKACTHECPTHNYFGEQFKYPQEYLRGFLSERSSSLGMCVSCGTCQLHCPVGIKITWLMMQAKEQVAPIIWSPAHYLVTNFELLGKSAHYMAPVVNRLTKNKVVRSIMDTVVEIDKRASLPSFAAKPFMLSKTNPEQINTKKDVVYFPGCQVNYSEPELGDTVVKLLEMYGIGVKVPDWHCCQIPRLGYGDRKNALKAIEYNIRILNNAVSEGKDIVVSCPSCLTALTALYVKCTSDPQFNLISDHIFDIHAYLLSLRQEDVPQQSLRDVRASVFYHIPCHTHSEGMNSAVQTILETTPGLAVVDSCRRCCGMSGTWGTKKSNYDLSLEVGYPLFEHIKASKADKVVTPCSGCKMRISAFSPVEVTYPLMMYYEGLKDSH